MHFPGNFETNRFKMRGDVKWLKIGATRLGVAPILFAE